jgi:ketosteroid isomerase-like protein
MTLKDGELNRTDVVEQIRVVFERYEAALREHDIAALNGFFLDSETTVRYGVTEHAVGMNAIRNYRNSAPPLAAGRRLQNTVITTYGTTTASVSTEFTSPDSPLIGRQTQAWALTRDGWKIIAAHVSQIEPERLR